MTDEEKDLLVSLTFWSSRIENAAGQFVEANTLGIGLPHAAGRQLRNLSEAVSACEHLVQTLAGRPDPSEDVLRQVAGHLRTHVRPASPTDSHDGRCHPG